ncbi:ABC transporter C family member 8 [Tanacetum coccineum]
MSRGPGPIRICIKLVAKVVEEHVRLLVVVQFEKTRADGFSEEFACETLSEPLLVHENTNQLQEPSFLSKLTFTWVNPLLAIGYGKPLVLEDIPSLASIDQAAVAHEKFTKAWDSLQTGKASSNTNMVAKALAKVYYKQLVFTGLCVLLRTIAVMVSPLLLYTFVNYTNSDVKTLNQGLILVGYLIGVKVTESLSHRQFFFFARRTGMTMRSALMVAVYEKQPKLSNLGRKRHSTGEVVNYIAVDAYRMGEFPMWFHVSRSSFIQLILAIGVLFSIVGIGVLPGQETTINLRDLKQHESHQQKVTVYGLVGAGKSPMLYAILGEVKVSFDRITSFLVDDELKENKMTTKKETKNSGNSIKIQNGDFVWDPESTTPTLRNVNLEVKHGQKVTVYGLVGAGKSPMLYAILGEVSKTSGIVDVCGSIAYVSQTSWIQSGTIQDNILYGKPMNRTMYEKAIKACALDKDIEAFKHGDLTEIGQRGLNMSGGQKQRIQLARAVYNDADIYLLDDPFSAVDAHTAASLFNDCVMTCLEGKTVILVTHQVEFLSSVDTILVMKDGQVTQSGNYEELLTAGTAFEQLVNAHKDVITGLEPSPHENKTEVDKTENKSYLSKENSEAEIPTKGLAGVQLTEEEEKRECCVMKTFLDYVVHLEGYGFSL